MEILDIVKTAVKAIDSKRGKDIKVIGITDLTILADYFIIATATSSTQVKALADEIEYKLKQEGIEPHHIEGKSSGWICLDYVTVVIHVFYKEQRDYYNLERLWGDGKEIDVSEFIDVENTDD